MFNIGGGEFVVIALIALIVLGPQRLPEAARQIGKTMGDLRRISSGFQNELKNAMEVADTAPNPAPARDVLAEEPAATPEPRPARRAPLKAAPAKKSAAPRKAAPISKGARPRSKSS
jgi:sec-independent protein translocase protein TatB